MLSTANYEARKYGARAAMPGFIAKKLCPHLILVKPNYKAYKEASRKVCIILSQYDVNYVSVSLDEAYLNLTTYLEHNNICIKDRGMIVKEIRDKIYKATNLTASAGIASNKLVAKVCSDYNKPNGQYEVKNDRDTIIDFVSQLNIRKISGIGKQQEKVLNSFGIYKCLDIYTQRYLLFDLFSDITFLFFLRTSMGICDPLVKKGGSTAISGFMSNGLTDESGYFNKNNNNNNNNKNKNNDNGNDYYNNSNNNNTNTNNNNNNNLIQKSTINVTRKSLSHESTFRNLADTKAMLEKILDLSEKVSRDLISKQLKVIYIHVYLL